MMEPLEIEVKFYLKNYEFLCDRVMRLGAKSLGRVFEHNIRFETADRRFIQKNSLLRLRRDVKSTLTFKTEAENPDGQFKVHKELEVEIDDFDTMVLILESLGLQQVQRYEKWRETLVLKDTRFCFDSMPFGNFLEIEGPKTDTVNWVRQIGLNWNKRILLDYLAMFEIIKAKEKLTFSDITFQNFTGLKIDLESYLDLFEIGKE